MAKTNTKTVRARTHGGAPAKVVGDLLTLRRSVCANLLWERTFYEDGKDVAERIKRLVPQCKPQDVADLAIEARHDMKLRHVPLLLARELARHPDAGGRLVGDTIAQVIERADEISEFVALYWKDGKQPLAKQVKLGLARAFHKFDEYQLAKYDRKADVELRDVLFLSHPKPSSHEQQQMWERLINGDLRTPDTWETRLSSGEDKKESFETLLREGKMGYMALLRNLRNMSEAGVNSELVRGSILAGKGAHRVLPFRFIAAARHAPHFERELDEALEARIGQMDRLPGTTAVVVDVSGSMTQKLSDRSDLTRMDAAAALGACVPAEKVRLFSFTTDIVEVPPRTGMAGVDAILNSQPFGMTNLGKAVRYVNQHVEHDRLIVVTDEQSQTRVPDPVAPLAYMVNVASYQNGIGYGKWTHIDGFSEAIFRFIREYEKLEGVIND